MRILVTGATGNVGRLVVDVLLALGATDVRALTARPEEARLPPGVETFKGWVGKPATVIPALAGVDRMYLAPHVPTSDEVCRLAAAAGVRRIVDLAGNEHTQWESIKRSVEAAGVPHVHLEAGEFMPNTLMWAGQIRAGDEVRDGSADAAGALIALEDIAAVAARCLLEEGHEGRTYELTGPESLTRRERVVAIGTALGRSLRYVELPPEEWIAQLEPEMGEYAKWYAEGQAQLASYPHRATTAVADILGRPGTTLVEWARANAAAFA